MMRKQTNGAVLYRPATYKWQRQTRQRRQVAPHTDIPPLGWMWIWLAACTFALIWMAAKQ